MICKMLVLQVVTILSSLWHLKCAHVISGLHKAKPVQTDVLDRLGGEGTV